MEKQEAMFNKFSKARSKKGNNKIKTNKLQSIISTYNKMNKLNEVLKKPKTYTMQVTKSHDRYINTQMPLGISMANHTLDLAIPKNFVDRVRL